LGWYYSNTITIKLKIRSNKMADRGAVERSGTLGSNVMEEAVEYYYGLYSELAGITYRANVSGEYVYYTGEAPMGATDIVVVRVP
jgi:hypothetical protein